MRTDEEIDAASAAAARATAAKTKTKAKAKAKAANKAKSKAKPTKTKAKAAAKAVYEKQTADRSRATVLIGAGNKGVYVSLEATGACGSSQKTHARTRNKKTASNQPVQAMEGLAGVSQQPAIVLNWG